MTRKEGSDGRGGGEQVGMGGGNGNAKESRKRVESSVSEGCDCKMARLSCIGSGPGSGRVSAWRAAGLLG